MEENVSILDIFTKKKKYKKKIIVRGWIKNRRNSKIGISFVDLYDGSCVSTIQIVIKNSIKNYYSEIIKLSIGCSLVVTGFLVYSYRKNCIFEIQAISVNVIGWIDNPGTYPISSKKHTLEYIRNFCHLRPRTNIIGVISRIRNIVYHSLHEFLINDNYLWINTPIITNIDSEGAGCMFKISSTNNVEQNKEFFNKHAFLTVSGQLTLEAYVCALSKVYTFGPTFRAENSNTNRHLAEFWMLEVESSYLNLSELSILSEKILKNSIRIVLEKCFNDLHFLEKNFEKNIFYRLENFLEKDFVNVNYSEVIQILKKKSHIFKEEISWGNDLSSIQEKYLVEDYFKSPVIIRNYPKDIKAFYMKQNRDNSTVAAIDVLIPNVGEIIGGSEREFRLFFLEKRMREIGLNIEEYSWYIDLRKYGTIPHAGFGLGFERLILYITGLSNIRESIPFPRTVGNLFF